MSLGEKNSLRHRTRQVLLKGRQDLGLTPQLDGDPIQPNVNIPLPGSSRLYGPISSTLWTPIATLRGHYNQLLGIANPSTASTFDGQVVGGVPLVGTFYPTPTPLSPVSSSASPTRSSPQNVQTDRPTVSIQSPTKSMTPIGPSITQPPRTPNQPAAVTSPVFTPMTPLVPGPSSDASTQIPEMSDNRPLSGGTIAGIIIGVLLLILVTLVGCWFIQRRRRAKQEKIKRQRQSFLSNPILNSLLVPSHSASSFRGTPYRGDEGDMYYAAPSVDSSTPSRFESTSRLSHRPELHALDNSHLHEVNYLEVMSTQPRNDSLAAAKETSSNNLNAHETKEPYLSSLNTYTNTSSQFMVPRVRNEPSEESGSFRTRRSTLRSAFSARSIIFPQVAIFRSGPKNEAGIPIQNLEANRVKSQIATGFYDYNEGLDQESDVGARHSQGFDPEFLSFYLPRAGDPTKISFNRVDLPTQSLISRTTNFSYPIPRVPTGESPPEVPGPILNRPRFRHAVPSQPGDMNVPPSPIHQGVESTRPGSTATPGFANNRYIPNKGRKRKTNANVLSVLHKSSLRKSSSKAVPVPKRQSASRRGDRRTVSTVSSIDVPDPYAYATKPIKTSATKATIEPALL